MALENGNQLRAMERVKTSDADHIAFKIAALTVLATLSVSLVPRSFAAEGGGGGLQPKIALAFPKTYDRYETGRLYEGFVHWVGRCANINFVDLFGNSLTPDFSAVNLLSEADLLEKMKSGKLQMMQVTTGQIPVVEEKADGTPFAVRGKRSSGTYDTYHVKLIVRSDSPFKKPTDLIGKKIAHSTLGSNSGNLVPRAYFPALGLLPDKNYTVVFSKGHERSIMGTYFGFWQAAAVASDQLDRMALKNEIKLSDYRVLWESEPFPVEAWVLSNQVAPDIQKRIKKCTHEYEIPPQVSKYLNGSDRFMPIDPVKDIATLRFVLNKSK